MAQLNSKEIVAFGVDAARRHYPVGYSAADASETLRAALIEANGGNPAFNRKAMRRNSVAVFEILEELIPSLIQEGLKGDEFFNTLVDDRNIALGDSITFLADDKSEFIVSQIADGIARPRRQRIGQKTEVSIPTSWHAVRIYEEWSRFVAGRIDWNELVDKVAKAFKTVLLNDVFGVFEGISAVTPGLSATYVKTGTYDEETLLGIADHLEASTGKAAYILGTKPALRKCTSAVLADEAKTAYYNGGYFGKLAGVPMVSVSNVHKQGTEDFAFSDSVLYVFASDDKPIKLLREGDPIVTEITEGNADETIEYTYKEKYGVGLIVNGAIGKYTIT